VDDGIGVLARLANQYLIADIANDDFDLI